MGLKEGGYNTNVISISRKLNAISCTKSVVEIYIIFQLLSFHSVNESGGNGHVDHGEVSHHLQQHPERRSQLRTTLITINSKSNSLTREVNENTF